MTFIIIVSHKERRQAREWAGRRLFAPGARLLLALVLEHADPCPSTGFNRLEVGASSSAAILAICHSWQAGLLSVPKSIICSKLLVDTRAMLLLEMRVAQQR
jgi:hypothetical protein